MNAQHAFSVVAVFYAVANLASMGLELNLRDTIKSLRSVRVLALTLGWSWVLGPAFAVLLTKVLPMAEPYATGLLIFSLAPTAPALPLFIRKARADMSLAAAIVGTSSQSGLADTVQSFFLSPVKPTQGGWIWGAGPALLLPTATDDLLGAEKWGAGPTAVLLKQQNGWTYGALANQLWAFAGESDRAEVNATFLQPFVSFTTKKAMTFTLNTESTYDWQNEQWTVPLNLMIQQLVKIGKQPVALNVGGRYYADKPDGGPDWGLRFAVILLFPKR